MRTVRRMYLYAVSLVSLEIALWGVINLARNILSPAARLQGTDLLASGLALVLVGLPIFVLHWWMAQRDAARDDDERASRVRGVFLYATLLATMIPVVQSLLAIVSRLLLGWFDGAFTQAVVGGQQTTLDNLISIVANGVVYLYFLRVLRDDWRANLPGSTLDEERRLYRAIWIVYGLLMLTAGVRLLLYYILGGQSSAMLPNGLALALVGGPVWAWNWRAWQQGADQPAERRSLLRLALLYLLALSGVLVSLASGASVLRQGIEILLGLEGWSGFLYRIAGALSTLIPAAMVWAYYSRELARALAAVPDETRRAAFQRGYTYFLALVGNVVTFIGVLGILQYIIRVQFDLYTNLRVLQSGLASELTAILIGVPLWLWHWRKAQAEAARDDDPGDHARRSTLRKGYLYLVMFATVVGSMVTAGWLLYLLFQRLLGNTPANFTRSALDWLAALVLFVIWLAYHLNALRADGRAAQRSLTQRHAQFPVLIVQGADERFAVELVQALQRSAPRMPIVVHRAASGPPADELLKSRAVVLTGEEALRPSPALRSWLDEFEGRRLVVPQPVEGWVWLGAVPRSLRELAQDSARALRELAEGQEVRPQQTTNPWAVTGAVLGGIFGLIVLAMTLLGVIASFG